MKMVTLSRIDPEALKVYRVDDPLLLEVFSYIEYMILKVIAIDDVPITEEERWERAQQQWESFLQKHPDKGYPAKLVDIWPNRG